MNFPNQTQGQTKCTMEFKIKSPSGCPGGRYKISKAYILLFITLLALVYLISGFAYNTKFNNQEGIEAIPHIEYLRLFPEYVKEGVSITLSVLNKKIKLVKSKFQANEYNEL